MKSWQKQLAALVLLKLAYFLLIAVLVLVWPASRDSAMARYERIQWTPQGHPTFESYFTTWDVGHYLYLSHNGYQSGHKSCAFYPLWPFLMRWSSTFTGGDDVISGTILANAFSLAGGFIFLRLTARRFGDSVAWLSLIFFLSFPGSLFFQFPYSESLFFLLVMLVCVGLEEGRLAIAIGAALLLPLTRAVGIFCIVPIGLHLIQTAPPDSLVGIVKETRVGRLIGKLPGEPRPDNVQVQPAQSCPGWANVCLLAAPVFGWALYFTLMWHWTGNPFEGFSAQKNWGVQSLGNLFNVPGFVVSFFTPTYWHAFSGSLLDRSAFVLLLYCLRPIWRLDKIWFVWAFVMGVVPAMSGHFTSFIRFEAAVFPVFVALAVCFRRKGPAIAILRLLTLATFVVLHWILLSRFVYFQWAG
jgi:hypothetical protein